MLELLHLSDVHFGPPHRSEVSDGVSTLLTRRVPRMVIISGDLTQRAKPRQFQAARAFCDAIENDHGIPTFAVPGNHDVPMYRVWERQFSPFGAYRRHFATDLEPVYDDDTLRVVGINSAFNWTVKDGRITARQLRMVDERLTASRAGQVKVVVLHHPLVPPPRFDNRRVVGRAVELAAVLARHGVDAVLAGHYHQGFISTTETYYPSGGVPVPLIHSGTSSSSRGRGCERGLCTANWLRFDEGTLLIERLRWSDAKRSFVRWSEHRLPCPRAAVDDELPSLGSIP